MSETKKMTNPLGRMTSRDVLVYAAGEEHGHCTVVAKGIPNRSATPNKSTISFKCICGVTYVVKASEDFKDGLRNVPEDRKL
jgi:hypothetical protein